jgi:hypothetical protein
MSETRVRRNLQLVESKHTVQCASLIDTLHFGLRELNIRRAQ